MTLVRQKVLAVALGTSLLLPAGCATDSGSWSKPHSRTRGAVIGAVAGAAIAGKKGAVIGAAAGNAVQAVRRSESKKKKQ